MDVPKGNKKRDSFGKLTQEEVDQVVRSERNRYDSLKTGLHQPSRAAIERKIQALKDAEAILHSIFPLDLLTHLNHEQDKGKVPRAPGYLSTIPDKVQRLNATFSMLKEAQEYLSRIPISTGRPSAIAGPGACAAELGKLFKEKTGKCHWEKIGEALAQGFPEFVPLKDDAEHPTDLRLWAYRLAKRHNKAMTSKRSGDIPKILGPLLWGSIILNYYRAPEAPGRKAQRPGA